MPVSSTLTTSAPKSANSSVQKPPGSSRVRSRTLTPLSGGTSLYPQEAARLVHGGRTTAGVLRHLSRLRDQVAVRARHLAVRQIEVVLEPDADRAAQRQCRRDQHPLLARDPDDAPV